MQQEQKKNKTYNQPLPPYPSKESKRKCGNNKNINEQNIKEQKKKWFI